MKSVDTNSDHKVGGGDGGQNIYVEKGEWVYGKCRKCGGVVNVFIVWSTEGQ